MGWSVLREEEEEEERGRVNVQLLTVFELGVVVLGLVLECRSEQNHQ